MTREVEPPAPTTLALTLALPPYVINASASPTLWCPVDPAINSEYARFETWTVCRQRVKNKPTGAGGTAVLPAGLIQFGLIRWCEAGDEGRSCRGGHCRACRGPSAWFGRLGGRAPGEIPCSAL